MLKIVCESVINFVEDRRTNVVVERIVVIVKECRCCENYVIGY